MRPANFTLAAKRGSIQCLFRSNEHRLPCANYGLVLPIFPFKEFYKKGCQEKSSPSTGRREDFCLEIQPTACARALRFAREVVLACLPFPWFSSSGGDDANRVLDLGKLTWYLGVNHGSIRGSWPIAISGYPRRHSVH